MLLISKLKTVAKECGLTMSEAKSKIIIFNEKFCEIKEITEINNVNVASCIKDFGIKINDRKKYLRTCENM